jgi:hypothetical protein
MAIADLRLCKYWKGLGSWCHVGDGEWPKSVPCSPQDVRQWVVACDELIRYFCTPDANSPHENAADSCMISVLHNDMHIPPHSLSSIIALSGDDHLGDGITLKAEIARQPCDSTLCLAAEDRPREEAKSPKHQFLYPISLPPQALIFQSLH